MRHAGEAQQHGVHLDRGDLLPVAVLEAYAVLLLDDAVLETQNLERCGAGGVRGEHDIM